VVKGTKEQIEIERHRFVGLIIYEVTSDEIDQIERETLSISEDLTFSTVSVSVAAAFLLTLLTVDIVSERLFNIFFIVCVAGFVGGAYFGVRWFRGRKSFRGAITRIKKRVGPLGEEGKELRPGEATATAPAPTEGPAR
jgi:hypothetical protein